MRIVLTGGPGGGKSTLMSELREEDQSAERWLLVPEAAPLLFRAGLDPLVRGFQAAVLRVQLALEDACAVRARPGQVLVCHRGSLDPLAYWLRNGWTEEEFFAFTATRREQHHRRYRGVMHLQTTAIGAENHYRRWPDAHRPETAARATETDLLCARVWEAHPDYVRIDNEDRGWSSKARVARDVLEGWLSTPAGAQTAR